MVAVLSSGGAVKFEGIEGTVFFLGKKSTFGGAFLPIVLPRLSLLDLSK